jgi:hypothetical protein
MQMQLPLDKAPTKKSPDDAFGFLVKFARRMRGKAFSPEAVTVSAMEKGVGFADARAWGPVFVQAAREGHIRRSTELFPRVMSNGSLRPGWIGL